MQPYFTGVQKDYACRCVTTVQYKYRNDIYNSKTVKMKEKMSKPQAESVCRHEAQSINATYTNFATNNGSWDHHCYL